MIAVLLAASPELFSQWAVMTPEADSLVILGKEKIYNCEFEEAEKIFQEVKDLEPDHPAGYFLDAMVYYWKLTLYRFTDYYHRPFLKRINKAIEVCDKRLDDNEHDIVALFFKGGAIGYRGRFYGENQNWVKSARDGLNAYNILVDCLKIAPNNSDILLGIGIFNYYTEAIPEKYPVTKPLLSFLPPGDKELGIAQLNAAVNHARYSGVEAETVLLQAFYSFDRNNSKALEIAQSLHERFPNNPYFHRYLGKCQIRVGDFKSMEALWREVLMLHINKKPGYDNLTAREALFNIGWALQKRKDYKMAIKYLNKCIEASKMLDEEDGEISGYRIEAELKVADCHYRLENYDKAIAVYKKVLKMREYSNSHKRAKHGIKKCNKS
jgi:tetratricopeptide (TPR) repeat protein